MKYHKRTRRSRPPSRVDRTRPARQTVLVSLRDLERLATALIDRRAELGVTQEEFVRRAGNKPGGKPALSIKQLQRIEGHQVSPRPQTLGALDRAAGWRPGSARRVLEGGAPLVEQPVHLDIRTEREQRFADALIDADFDLDDVSELLEVLRAIDQRRNAFPLRHPRESSR